MENFLESTGERYLPWMEDPKIHYEHLHRYWIAKELASGKTVLDMASGEGYGSYMMSAEATSVFAVDQDHNAVLHATRKYTRENLQFAQGSITELPLKKRMQFDLIVCFEALEHISEHEMLMKQVGHHLSKEGLFIVSTPNKLEYSDAACYTNPFHVKELYLDEFKRLLKSRFTYVEILGQKLAVGSRVYHLDHPRQDVAECFIKRGDDSEGTSRLFQFANAGSDIPEYYIAFASDVPLSNMVVNRLSYLIDASVVMYKEQLALKKRFDRYYAQCEKNKRELANVHLDLLRVQKEQHSKLQILEKEKRALSKQLDAVLNSKAWRLAEQFRYFIYHILLRR